jgi:3-(3-hydroxy-phenyl)propionate hydroxylase
MSRLPDRISVVVVGAGPTGLTTANLLAKYGIGVIVLDRAPAPLDLPRAIVLDDEGARTLQAFGLQYVSAAKGRPATGARYYDEEGQCFAETGTGIESYGFPKRCFIFQPELEKALRDRLDEQAPGALHFGAEVTAIENLGDHAMVQVTTTNGAHRITADWVLACDGGRSPSRERLGISMVGKTYGEDWIVIDTQDDPDQDPFSKFYCSRERPQLSVPAPHGGRRFEFMMLPGETPEKVLEAGFVAELLRPYRGTVVEGDILRKTVYTFHARIANSFRKGRVLLLGDAAHLTPPFAGQGMNAGLRDAHNVAWKVASVVSGGASSDLLDTYFDERRDPAWDMIQLAVAMGEIVMPLDPAALEFRRLLLKALEPFPKVRDYLIQMRFKPRPRYQRGAFVGLDAPEFEADLTGEMIPQPWVETVEGRCRLDELLGPGFALIVQDDAGATEVARLGATRFAGLPLQSIRLDFGGDRRFEEGAVRPSDAAIARPLRTHRDRVLLIRPDRYCAASFATETLADGLAAYERILGIGSPMAATAASHPESARA